MKKTPEAALHLLGGMAERMDRAGRQLEYAPVLNLNGIEKDNLTLGDRIAKWVAQFAGSPAFLGLHAAAFLS